MDRPNFNMIWLNHACKLSKVGGKIDPRGKATKELLHESISLDMRRPVLTIPGRKMHYKFMAAEAYWILTGDDKVEGIAPYNKRISEFSDDGEKFFGAYGPKIIDQLPYVVQKLKEDPFSRQAGLTIWRENPPATKDVPCTISVFFSIRDGLLHAHANMRSSDIWLGIPYDAFNFSMLGHLVCCRLNACREKNQGVVRPGTLTITMTSSHLYVENEEALTELAKVAAKDIIIGVLANEKPKFMEERQPSTPSVLYAREDMLMKTLKELRETSPGDPLRWWEGEE